MEIVKVVVDDIDDIFNQFDSNDISDELATYIEMRCSRVQKNELSIKIITRSELDDKTKDRVVDAIRCHFGLETKYTILDTKKRKTVNIIYFFLGVFILLFKNLLPLTNTVFDIFDVLGCFIIWESTFNLLFTDNEMDRKIDRAKKIRRCQIKFEYAEE